MPVPCLVKEPDPSSRAARDELLKLLGTIKVMSSLEDERTSESEIFDVPELKVAGLLTPMASMETMPFVFNESPIARPLKDSDRLVG